MLPQAFQNQLVQLLGPTEAEALCRALCQTQSPVSVRFNPLKPCGSLPAEVDCEVPWCCTGRFLTERPRFTYDPLLHAGCYYVQEAASMFVEQAYRKICEDFKPRRVLDLCAAPGGKSTLWRTLLDDGALLVANEPVRARAQVLAENLTKWGHPDVVCASAYPEEYAPLTDFFDVVATDVPCSGEGMFRKDSGSIEEWSPEAVDTCAARQRQIVASVWNALRPGGYLVYSTCTYNRFEDEDNVEWICHELGAEPVPINTDPTWDIAGDTTRRGLPVYRFFPHRTRGEGLFLALLQKEGESAEVKVKKEKHRRPARRQASAPRASEVCDWLADASGYRIFRPDETHLAAVRQSLFDDVAQVSATVRCLTAGVTLAEEKGRKLIPQHALSLSSARRAEAFPQVELSLDEALAYLRRESLTLAPSAPRGYVIVSFQNYPLGFVNNLGARANNLYPQEWRIRN